MAIFNLKENVLTQAENNITGTNGDDIFYIYHNFYDSNPIIENPSSKASQCPSIGYCELDERLSDQFQNDGKDIYYLASDIDTKNQTFIGYNYPHDGGHRAFIRDFDVNLDKIVLPQKIKKENLRISRKGNTHSEGEGYLMEIIDDPNSTFELARSLSKIASSAEDLIKLQSLINTYDILAEIETNTNSISEIMERVSAYSPQDKQKNDQKKIYAPTNFIKKSADKITNFNPSTDTLEIDTKSFGIDSSATFAAGKNKKAVKKKLAKQDFDFLYDQKKGGLYFNENGSDKGFGDGGIIAILKGAPDLTAGNLEFM